MTNSAENEFFDGILQHLQQARGFDVLAYKRTSLMRRVVKRMQDVNVPTFEAYLDYLQVHQEEFAPLFNSILINVTSFFRDQEVWTYLAGSILPELVANGNGGAIRVWSAGCASGQEPYTLAMLLAEVLGNEGLRDRVKIYATDVDQEALTEARLATYDPRQITDVPPALLAKYFDRSGTHYVVNRELRRSVIFGRHDLLTDAPISRVDLLMCRNTLMYLNAEAQSRILARFYFSLNQTGYVTLGRAEMLFSHAAMFLPVDLKRRIFRPVGKPNHRDRLLLLAQTGRDTMTSTLPNHARLRDAAFDSDLVPQIVIDAAGFLAACNGPAREKFNLSNRDIGRGLQDLEISYRPVELRTAIERSNLTRQDVTITDVQWSRPNDVRYLQVVVAPLQDDDRVVIGTRVSFHDVTEYKNLEVELQHSKHELETAYEELQSTNEELETTNEELQSTVEELETTNEELQSTNEELETMNEELQSTNEELQSTNEELQTMNDELRNRSTDLKSANAFLGSVFTSLRSAVIVLDREYRVLVWNDRAMDLWGVRPDEALQNHFMNLDISLPVAELRAPIRDVLNGGPDSLDVVLSATSRRGRPIDCRVTVSPLRHRDRSVGGVILLMEDRSGVQPS